MENGVHGVPSTEEEHERGKCPHSIGQQPSGEKQGSPAGHHKWQWDHRPTGNPRQRQAGIDHSARAAGINQEGK
eukprot:11405176-Heterocapsa_arctica.AAC.1